MKIVHIKTKVLVFLFFLISLIGCKKDNHYNSEAGIINSFSVKNENNTVFKAKINGDRSITIKVSPYVDAVKELASAVPVFYLSKGATVYPDPALPQNFAQEGGVKYTVTAEDGKTKQDYIVSWGISDLLADGEGFSYAEVGVSKNFVELGYPGEFNNFNLSDAKQYGDLIMYPAYCGNHIVLFSQAYANDDPASPYVIKVFNKETLVEESSLNLADINLADLKLLSSDYKGNMVGMFVKNGETEFYYWTSISSTPQSLGKVAVNMASTTDGSANFQVAGDITQNAWITAMAPRNLNGEHYRLQVKNGKLANDYNVVTTGHPSNDGSSFQMISPLSDADQPSFVVGDTDGSPGAANSIKVYVNSFAGLGQQTMPGFWQNILQEWWVGTGMSTTRVGGRSPFVSGMVINGKSYAIVTSGTAWWHAAAVLTGDLQNLAHENLNIVQDISRGWSYGSFGDWYYNEETKEAYLAIWFGRIGLKTYKLTCYE